MTKQDIEIVVVEDNPGDAELTIRALKKKNLDKSLIHLSDGAEALDFIFCRGAFATRQISHLPKVILLDLKMPKVDGLEVLEKIKNDPRTRSIPIVILTSSGEDPDIRRAYDLGANSYIIKPVDFEEFSRTVGDLGLYWMEINRI